MTSGESPNLENLLQLGIAAAKEGNREGARVLLRQVLDGDKKNDRAWYWLAYVADSKPKRRQYLEAALKANPKNQAAQRALMKITTKRSNQERRTLITGVVVILIILIVTSLICLIALLA